MADRQRLLIAMSSLSRRLRDIARPFMASLHVERSDLQDLNRTGRAMTDALKTSVRTLVLVVDRGDGGSSGGVLLKKAQAQRDLRFPNARTIAISQVFDDVDLVLPASCERLYIGTPRGDRFFRDRNAVLPRTIVIDWLDALSPAFLTHLLTSVDHFGTESLHAVFRHRSVVAAFANASRPLALALPASQLARRSDKNESSSDEDDETAIEDYFGDVAPFECPFEALTTLCLRDYSATSSGDPFASVASTLLELDLVWHQKPDQDYSVLLEDVDDAAQSLLRRMSRPNEAPSSMNKLRRITIRVVRQCDSSAPTGFIDLHSLEALQQHCHRDGVSLSVAMLVG